MQYVSAWKWRTIFGAIMAICSIQCGEGCSRPQLSRSFQQNSELSPRREGSPSTNPPWKQKNHKISSNFRKISEKAKTAHVTAQNYTLGKSEPLFDIEEWFETTLATETQYASLRAIQTPTEELDFLPGSAGNQEEIAIDGRFLGQWTPVIPSSSQVFANFYAALLRLQQDPETSGKVRIAVYGASHTAADIYTSYLRSYLQQRFGDGGLGFVSLVRTNPYYRPYALTVESSKGWQIEHAQRRKTREDGYYGLLGASATAQNQKDYGRVVPNRRAPTYAGQIFYDIYFLAQPKGGNFSLVIADEQRASIRTQAKKYQPGYFTATHKGGLASVEIRPQGKKNQEVRLFGMVIENDQPGVVVDTLGINGTRAANHLKWDDAIWSDNIKRRKPDLYILAYGTNEAIDEDEPIESYREDLRAVLERFKRVLPQASCLLVGPGDFQRKSEEDEVYAPVLRTAEIALTQREVAQAMGCGYWDTLTFMGGIGGMTQWVQAQPAMGKADHIHLTREGYVRMGMALTAAIMEGFPQETVDKD